MYINCSHWMREDLSGVPRNLCGVMIDLPLPSMHLLSEREVAMSLINLPGLNDTNSFDDLKGSSSYIFLYLRTMNHRHNILSVRNTIRILVAKEM